VLGRRYAIPLKTRVALERVFEASVDGIIVIENSLYACAHFGMYATTRPNRILLINSGAEFVSNSELLLHEYFHVIRQWRPGHLTRWRYLAESALRGYQANRFEQEARAFAASARERFDRYLSEHAQ
jgi:Zn-dependent peptidase ImmA (M78 family)